jgi:glycosyltransferase involved in cell wall biosynthesis
MRKLLIQIPCYNEEQVLPRTLAALPRHVPGFDRVEWLIIDDGSTDQTVAVARQAGADHIVSLPRNQGLARAFVAGLEACLKAGADVIVNTDADNQYDAVGIPALVEPILSGRAQIVIGERPIMSVREFSLVKKLLQKLGSAVVKIASNTRVPDAPSGFRAMHSEAALRLCVFSDYTYTLETIIQAGAVRTKASNSAAAYRRPACPARSGAGTRPAPSLCPTGPHWSHRCASRKDW